MKKRRRRRDVGLALKDWEIALMAALGTSEARRAEPHPTKPPAGLLPYPTKHLGTSDCRISANSCPFDEIFIYLRLPRRALSIRRLQFAIRSPYAERITSEPLFPACFSTPWARNSSNRLNTSSINDLKAYQDYDYGKKGL